MPVSIARWSPGPGKHGLKIGDMVRIDSGQARYRITDIRQHESGAVEVHAYGGKGGRLGSRVFTPEQVTRVRSTRDPNSAWRDALHEMSVGSKRRKNGRKR